MTLPRTPALATDCVVFDPLGRVLLIRRGHQPCAGKHALPGGFVKIGETVASACRREVKEETGIEVAKISLVGVYSDIDRDPRGHIVSVAFMTELTNETPPRDERTRPRSHIAMAFRIDPSAAIDGMFIGIDEPTHSLRTGRDQHGLVLIVLGSKFPTGHDGDVAKHFRDLEAWTRRNLEVGEVAWRWVNEDYDTADRVPFAGALAKAPGLYAATGFNAWGISNGTAAGILIAEQILGGSPDWAPVYDPMRKVPRKFNKGGDSRSLVHSLDDIEPGGGAVMNLGRGRIAVWKGADGIPHAISASCTHKGCTVTWNNADRTWDCPCHGSIFAIDGSVIHGPAVEPLSPKKFPPSWLRKA